MKCFLWWLLGLVVGVTVGIWAQDELMQWAETGEGVNLD